YARRGVAQFGKHAADSARQLFIILRRPNVRNGVHERGIPIDVGRGKRGIKILDRRPDSSESSEVIGFGSAYRKSREESDGEQRFSHLFVLPAIEAFSRFLSEFSGGNHLPQNARRLESRPERLGKVFGDAETDVETDEIGQTQRSHRMVVAELHGAVD